MARSLMLIVTTTCLVGVLGCGEDAPAPRPQGAIEQRGAISVVWLRGTPYEMGRQHAQLLYDGLVAGREFIEGDLLFSMMLEFARSLELTDDAAANSYDDVLEECRGMVDGMDGHWTLDECLTLAYGDVIVDIIKRDIGLGCSQFVGTGSATTDGRLIHGRNLDWWQVPFIEQHPVVFVREPDDGIPFVTVGFPGNISPYTGMNAAGIAIASNEVSAPLGAELDREGRSNVQMVREVLRTARSVDEAAAFLAGENHESAEILVVSDGNTRQAAAFEITAAHFAMRPLVEGVLYATNHFVHPDMQVAQEPEPTGTSSWNRFERLRQLLAPDASESRYGALDAEGAVAILRDTYNPTTGEWIAPEVVDGGDTLANNGAMQSVVFIPGERIMYVALGAFPVTMQAYQGFSLDELLGDSDAPPPSPESFPAQ